MNDSNPDIPGIPGVFPTVPRSPPVIFKVTPRRSFSRRGMRLGIHMSILDIGAHSAPDDLKKKWIQKSRSHHPVKHSMSAAISPDKTRVKVPLEEGPNKANLSSNKKESKAVESGRKSSQGWISSPTAGKLHRMIDHLEPSHSTGISKLVPQRRRRSSIAKDPGASAQAQEIRRRHPSATGLGTATNANSDG